MGIFSKLFAKKDTEAEKGWRVGGMEDFVSLIRVYYQAVMASQMGISNLAAFPDLRVFKQTLHVSTINNKLGINEKKRCKEMLSSLYGMPANFFSEIDASIKKNCRTPQQMQQYLFQFQGFTQELMMLVGNLMKWKFRVPSFMRKALYSMTQKTIADITTKDSWKDEGIRRSVIAVRQYQRHLDYSAEWMTEYVFHIIILAKKEPNAEEKAKNK